MSDNAIEYELLPSARMLLSSLRSVGYTEETAIADIVDNSISAGAKKIEIYFDWEQQQILISDNGTGMSGSELLKAMKIGSSYPNDVRSTYDLGRFGMGMKTAAFSLARNLLVITKNADDISNAEWNLDYVEAHNKWNILIRETENIKDIITLASKKIGFSKYEYGTLVCISDLDRLIDTNNLNKSKKKFYKIIEKVKEHLSMIFHRFIEEDDLDIFINGNLVMPWNPFDIYNPATMELSSEICYDGVADVFIEPYVLPHKSKFANEDEFNLAGGFKGWLNHQGFYVYRNKRLIVYGTWFGKFKKEPAYNLARIKLDMNSESDFEWGIDIKKSKATLPVAIEESITQIAYLTIERSVAVYNSRGTYKKNNGNNTSLKYVWEQRKNASGNYMFYLNKKHPMLMKLIQELDYDKKDELKTYLSLVENYSPTMLSGVIVDNQNNEVNDDTIQKDLESVKNKINILRKLQFENDEIFDVLSETPEYSYLKEELKKLLED